jgi:hypothetical protein
VSEETTAAAIVEGLAGAWTISNLYPDPESQSAFQRLGENIREAVAAGETWLDVGPGFFLDDDAEVEAVRESASRLAQRCYVHNIASLGVTGPASDRELAAFMKILAMDDEAISDQGGLSSLLQQHAITDLAVVTRVPLTIDGGELVFERPDEVLTAMAGLANPEAFARGIVEEAEGDPERLGELYHERFVSTYEMIEEGDVVGQEQVVQAFVEAFFYLEETHQIAVMGPFLRSADETLNRLFLDQFAGHELATIAPRLDSHGFALLMDYARIATDVSDNRPDEILGWLGTPEGAASVVQTVAARVQDRLVQGEDRYGEQSAFEELRTQFPDPRHYFYSTLDIFRGLVAVEDRNDRYRRLMRLLTGKIVASIRREWFRRAELWMRSVIDAPTFPEERAREVDDALRLACTNEVLNSLVGHLASSKTDSVRYLASRLVGLNMPVGLDLLGAEEDRARRRALIGILGEAARNDPEPVITALDDERWFVVRNLVIVLRNSGSTHAAPELARLTHHEDHRVRVEAVRGLAIVAPEDIATIGERVQDEHESVRRTAVGVLAVRPGPEAESLMVAALDGNLNIDEKADLVRHLGERGTPASVAKLEQLAKRRFAFTSRARTLRKAAIQALGATK